MQTLIGLVISLCQVNSMGLTGYHSEAARIQYNCQAELLKCALKNPNNYAGELGKCVGDRKKITPKDYL